MVFAVQFVKQQVFFGWGGLPLQFKCTIICLSASVFLPAPYLWHYLFLLEIQPNVL